MLTMQISELQEQVEALKQENRELRESLKSEQSRLQAVVEKLPLAVVAVGRNGRIEFCNSRFSEMISYAIADADISPRTLAGSDISRCIASETMQMVKNSLSHNCDIVGQNATCLSGYKCSVSLYYINRGDFSLMVVRDIFDNQMAREEIEERLRAVIDRNMLMIQNIASLLGEETSETTRILGSVIKSL